MSINYTTKQSKPEEVHVEQTVVQMDYRETLSHNNKRARVDQSATKTAKKNELMTKLAALKKAKGPLDAIVETLFKLVYVLMELTQWATAGEYSSELRTMLVVDDSMSDLEKQNVSALQGACEFYIGLNLAHQNDLVGAIKHYKMSLRLFGEPKRYRSSFARLHRRIGDAILQLTKWKGIGNVRKRVFLLTAWKHFALSAEAFILDIQFDEWQLCIKAIMLCSKCIVEIDRNNRMMMEDTLQFLKRQLQRTDLSETGTARSFLNNLLQESCMKRVDNVAIFKDTQEIYEEIKKLRAEIVKLDCDNLDRKSIECKLAILHIKVGENLDAIFVLLDTLKGVTWATNPNLMSFSYALMGVCWLNLGDPEAALPYLRDAEYSFDTDHSSEDFQKVKDKRIIAELRLQELQIKSSPSGASQHLRSSQSSTTTATEQTCQPGPTIAATSIVMPDTQDLSSKTVPSAMSSGVNIV